MEEVRGLEALLSQVGVQECCVLGSAFQPDRLFILLSCFVWVQVKRQAATRQQHLEQAGRLQSFQQSAKELQRWVSSVREHLVQDEMATDVASAVALLEQHQELQLEMKEQKSRYKLLEPPCWLHGSDQSL